MGRQIRWKNNPAPPGHAYRPTQIEQVANCLTHLPWVPLSLVGLFRLHSKSITSLEGFVALAYGLTVVFLFFTSSAFHVCYLFAHDSSLRPVLHLCDRISIYFFIAGSYLPWLLLRDFHNSWGEFTFYCVLVSTLMGICFQYVYLERCKKLEFLVYLTIAICPAYAMLHIQEHSGLDLMLLGAMSYTLGAVFFKLDGRIPLAHAIWHCFVFVGALLQFLAVELNLFRR